MRLEPLDFSSLQGLAQDETSAAFVAFHETAAQFLGGKATLRPARAVDEALRAIFTAALEAGPLDDEQALRFFKQHFVPHRVHPDEGAGFLTGYYEPEVDGALTPSAEFAAPILARPSDLVTLADELPHLPGLSAARRRKDGTLVPYHTRAEIESAAAGEFRPLLYLRDAIEVFLIQVQGSARVRLPNGRLVRLRYDGRNGHPYTSIGRILIECGAISAKNMSLSALKSWLRANGLQPGGPARQIMQQNHSYIFFAADQTLDENQGPIGGAGVSLWPLRSLAIDRNIWSYGLPFWIKADLPWNGNGSESFCRLMIAQDTGSAILGPARGDVFFGTGEKAGHNAGNIRHPAEFVVFLPKNSLSKTGP